MERRSKADKRAYKGSYEEGKAEMMNNQEAAEQIEQIISDNNIDDGIYLGLRDIQALRIAVLVLRSLKPDVPDSNVGDISICRCQQNDLIRREDAVSRISDLLMLELCGERLPTWDEVYNAMQDVPSAKPKIHTKTIKDIIELFEPYLTTDDLLECLEELKKADMRGEQE